MKKEHKKSELWVFYVGCYLDIRNRLLGTSRFKGTKGKGKVVWASTLGPLVSFLGAKRVQPRFVKVKGLGQVRPGFKPGIGSSFVGQRATKLLHGQPGLPSAAPGYSSFLQLFDQGASRSSHARKEGGEPPRVEIHITSCREDRWVRRRD